MLWFVAAGFSVTKHINAGVYSIVAVDDYGSDNDYKKWVSSVLSTLLHH